MVKKWYFKVALFCCIGIFTHAQEIEFEEDFKEQGFSLKVQALTFLPYDDGTNRNIYKTDYEIEDNTFIYGFNTEINYYFSPHFGLGIGIGYEKVNQPNFSYFPVYINGIGVLNETKNAIYVKFNYGGHLGNLDKAGAFVRGGLGYRFKVFKNILSNLELSYTYQNMYKSFENSNRPENYYNIEAIGLTIGIEFN